MNNTEALKTLFQYAVAEVTNPTNTNAYFESPLIWQAEVLVAVKALAEALGIDLSETDIDIEDFEKGFEEARESVSDRYGKLELAQADLTKVSEMLES